LAGVLDGVGQPIERFVRLSEETGVDRHRARGDLLALLATFFDAGDPAGEKSDRRR
jgi:hypothetical protein